MRIAFVTQPGHAVMPAAGSIELWAEAVAERLTERHEVTVYASAPPRGPAPDGSAIAYRFVEHGRARLLTRALRLAWRALPDRRPFFASLLHPVEYWLRVAWRIRRDGADVVHVFNYSQALPFLRRLTGAKLVLHMHCEWLSQLDRRMIDRRLDHADLIVGCSDHVTDLIRERFPRHAARCRTIYNGIDPPATPPEEKPSTHPDTAIRLLNVGRVSPEKGLHVLLDALELLVGKYPGLRLTILGEESPVPLEFAVRLSDDVLVQQLARFYGTSYLEHITARMSPAVAERVTFLDRVPHSEALRFYRDADIFVYPSLFESFAIPPVEAMAAGLPVVASSVGGMRETIVDGGTGLSVPAGDAASLATAIARLIDDPALRRSLGASGTERAAAMYSWNKITQDVEDAFTSLLGRVSPAPTAPEVARRS